MYELLFTDTASQFFEQADAGLQRRLERCFRQLEDDPYRHANITCLKGKLAGHYRYRVGNYRVVYRVEEDRRAAIVVIIAHRREAYR